MPFATHYGKYFQNSIREEALIATSRAGIIYGEGGGGTLREIFHDVELNFYAKTPNDFTPMILASPRDRFWQREAVVENLFGDPATASSSTPRSPAYPEGSPIRHPR